MSRPALLLLLVLTASACTDGTSEPDAQRPPVVAGPSASPSASSSAAPGPDVVPTVAAPPPGEAYLGSLSVRPVIGDHWRLRSTPAGYQAPVVANYSAPDGRVVQYVPTSGPSSFGRRISVQASSYALSDLIGVYPVLGETTMRDSRPATYFRAGVGGGARSGLVWRHDDGMLLTVYAYADLATLRELAADVEPCGPQAC